MSIRRSLAILRAACVATIIAVFPGPAGACARHLVAGLAIESAATNPAVRVLLNGRPARLYFDTGAEHTILTAAAVGRLALPTDWLGFQPLWGIGGLSMHFNARVARFSVGGLVLPEESLAVGDFGATWRDSSDGLLGAEIIGRYDADIDFSRGHVGLFRAVRCDHPAPGWKAPFTALKLRDLGPFRHVAITGARIDGAPVTATIDTGAERSTITRQAALRLGATEAALRADPASLMIGVGSQTQSYRLHEFGALMFGGAIWRAPKLMVGPLPPFLGDMLLGVDFLRRHRIWISWANGMVFVARPADKSDTKQGFAPRSVLILNRAMRSACLALFAGTVAFGLSACDRVGPSPTLPPQAIAADRDCPLERVAAIAVTMRRDQPRIVARVNGEPALLVFDTGAGASVILRAAVARLHPREDPDHTLIAAGVGGTSRAHPLIVDSFEVGGLALRDQRFGTGDIGANLAKPAPDGMLGNDILSGFDIDLDLADGQATLYRARECPRGAPPWTGPYATVPLLRDPGFAPLYGVPIELDGYTLMATIDTGSETTVISSAAAAAIGITPAMLAGDPGGNVSGLGRETLAARRHTFHALSIGTLTIADPRLSVFPLPDFAGDVLLGTDIMRHHRVWLAYATHRMLISLP